MSHEDKQVELTTRAISIVSGSEICEQRFRLVQLAGPEVGKTFALRDERTVVGKSVDCDIPVADLTVSRKHFAVVNENGRYLVKDLGSTNGTYLDGAGIKEAYLRAGGLIKAGEVVFRFQPEYDQVRVTPSDQHRLGDLVGSSLRMREIFATLEKVARSDATVLIFGETGSGKGAAVSALHQASQRKNGPLTVMDCASVARNLMESELFGHLKGAFTGASSRRLGALEASKGGTLFIDELDDLPLDLQPKLLRAIEERVFMPLGSNKPVKFDARVVAASKKDLWKEVSYGNFREDLYYRLSVVSMRLPPLRERPEDIPLLFDHFSKGTDLCFDRLSRDVQTRWLQHTWPGNVREIRNAVERLHAFGADGLGLNPETGRSPGSRDVLLRPDLESPFKQAKEKLILEFERKYLERLMQGAKDGIAGAARRAGIDRKHLYSLLERHGFLKKDDQKES